MTYSTEETSMINVYHRAGYDCVVIEEKSEQDQVFIHVHDMPGGMTLREILVDSPNGPVFDQILEYEEECDQSRKR
jgi:hypothetical protein